MNTIGLVPDQLKLLAEDPSSELPNIQAVFSWGEKLPINVAQRWSNHPKARLRELLVSTEYWLSFYSAPLEGIGRHRIVGGVETLIIDQAEQDGTGELVIRGPMVTTGDGVEKTCVSSIDPLCAPSFCLNPPCALLHSPLGFIHCPLLPPFIAPLFVFLVFGPF